MPTYSIGRKLENDVVIDEKQISKIHALLHRISEGTFLLEDNESAGGTFVDKLSIKRKVVTLNDNVTFTNRNFTIRQLIEMADRKREFEETMPNIVPEFSMLKNVYEIYAASRNAVERNGSTREAFIKAVGSAIPIVGNALAILASHFLSDKEKIKALEEEFRLSYNCPSCKHFLGFKDWETLYENGKCKFCRFSWET